MNLCNYLYYQTYILMIQVYWEEYHERSQLWYVIAGILLVVLFFATFFSSYILGDNQSWLPSWTDMFSAVLLIALCWWYRHYTQKTTTTVHDLAIVEQWVSMWEKLYARDSLRGFGLEMKIKTWDIHNILLVTAKSIDVYTIVSSQDEIVPFVHALEEHIPFIEQVEQRWFDRLLRRLKI